MNKLIPVKNGNLPAKRTSRFAVTTDLATGSGFPVISVKGKEFARVEGGERHLIIDPTTEEVATKLELVVVNYNANISKVYYEKGYTDGSAEKPDCYSEDGKAPAGDAQRPQHTNCATCPHNQWGSRITESGAKAKNCQDSRRLAVTTGDNFDDPMLLRVPATSLKNLGQYQKQLALRGYALQEVVTRVGFQAGEAYPMLTFKATALLDDESLDAIERVMSEDIVQDIIGATILPTAPKPAVVEEDLPVVNKTKSKVAEEVEEEVEEDSEPEPKPKPKPKPKAKAKVQVEPDEEAAGEDDIQPKPKAKPEPERSDDILELSGDLETALDELLGDL